MAIDFFGQKGDSVKTVETKGSIFEGEFESIYSLPQVVLRSMGVIAALGLGVAGMTMIIRGRPK